MIKFYKFHGAGNDFILVDNRSGRTFSKEWIAKICHRRFGIGADGFITLSEPTLTESSFSMQYYNSDGNLASLCGNGSRCITAFAHHLGISDQCTRFEAFDGIHTARIIEQNSSTEWEIEIEMRLNGPVQTYEDGYFLDTGSPHFVQFVKNIEEIDVYERGKRLRQDSRFPNGCNVNFVEIRNSGIFVRTYERGVEDETLSCGTGVTASAIVYAKKQTFHNGEIEVPVATRGGDFSIRFTYRDDYFSKLKLIGPVTLAFYGEIQS